MILGNLPKMGLKNHLRHFQLRPSHKMNFLSTKLSLQLPYPSLPYNLRFINRHGHHTNMNQDELKGKSKKLKGQIREEIGKLTDNKTEQLKGKIEQVEGKVQEEVGKVTDMSDEEVMGRSKHIKGQIREEVGKITDNKTEQIKGKIEQVEGKAQEEIGKVKRKAKE
jgi:uncharacterized protein YjbJ (UPF0337 family)